MTTPLEVTDWSALQKPEFRVSVGPDGDVAAWATVFIGQKKYIVHVDYPEEWDEDREDGLESGSAAAFTADLLAGRMICQATPLEHAPATGFFLVRRFPTSVEEDTSFQCTDCQRQTTEPHWHGRYTGLCDNCGEAKMDDEIMRHKDDMKKWY